MVRKYWVVIAFAAGIAVGWIFTRPGLVEPVAVVLPKPVETGQASTSPSPAGPAPELARQPDAAPVAQSVPAARPPVGAVSSEAIVPAEPAAPGYDGYSQAIDVSPMFREQFEHAQKLGTKGSLFELHQSLEREVRNDTWAYAAEADIQNSLVVESSSGNFKVDHLECRATMCELQLSARGKEQAAALGLWLDGMQGRNFETLLPRASSSIGHDANRDVLMIFVRPPPKPAPAGQG